MSKIFNLYSQDELFGWPMVRDWWKNKNMDEKMNKIEQQACNFGGAPVRSELPVYTIGDEKAEAVLDSGELSGFMASNAKEFWVAKMEFLRKIYRKIKQNVRCQLNV